MNSKCTTNVLSRRKNLQRIAGMPRVNCHGEDSSLKAYVCAEIGMEATERLDAGKVQALATTGLLSYYTRLSTAWIPDDVGRYKLVDFIVGNSNLRQLPSSHARWDLAGVEMTDNMIASALQLKYFPPGANALCLLQGRSSDLPPYCTEFFSIVTSENMNTYCATTCKSPSIQLVTRFVRDAIWVSSGRFHVNFTMVANLARALKGEEVNWARLLGIFLKGSIKSVQQARVNKDSDIMKIKWSVIAGLIIAHNFPLFQRIPGMVCLRDQVKERDGTLPTDHVTATDTQAILEDPVDQSNKRVKLETGSYCRDDSTKNAYACADNCQMMAMDSEENIIDFDRKDPEDDHLTGQTEHGEPALRCSPLGQLDGASFRSQFPFTDGFSPGKLAEEVSRGVALITGASEMLTEYIKEEEIAFKDILAHHDIPRSGDPRHWLQAIATRLKGEKASVDTMREQLLQLTQELGTVTKQSSLRHKEIRKQLEDLNYQKQKLEATIRVKDEQMKGQEEDMSKLHATVTELRNEKEAQSKLLSQVENKIRDLTRERILWIQERMQHEKFRMEQERKVRDMNLENASLKAQRDEERLFADKLRVKMMKQQEAIARLELEVLLPWGASNPNVPKIENLTDETETQVISAKPVPVVSKPCA